MSSKKHTLPVTTSKFFIPVSILFLLIIGIFISLVQVQQPQQNKSNAQTALKNCDVPSSESALNADEKAMFDTINTYRKQNGLKELYYDANLQRSAQWMSNDMYTHKTLDHTDSLGRGVDVRLTNCGLTDQTSWGENIAEGYNDVVASFQGWKNSPGHNANMLGNFTHMGIAVNNTYWTLDLATIPSGGTLPPPLVPGITLLPTISIPQTTITLPVTVQPTSKPSTTPTPISSGNLPDLLIDDMRISTNGNVCGPLGVLLTIKNVGADVNAPIVVQANTGVGTIGGGIPAGGTKTIWIQSLVYSGQTIALVDPSNSIPEKDETNNQLKLFLPVPTTAQGCPTPTPIPTGGPSNTGLLTPVPTTYPGFIVNPNDTQVLVSIKLPGIGIGGNKSPVHLSRKVSVTLYDLENEQAAVGSGFLTYDKNDLFRGIIHLGKGINSTYYVKVVADHTLQAIVMPQFQPILNDRLNVLSPVILIPGEFTGDNQLTIADFNIALTCFQDKKCSTKPVTDANNDGTINVYDVIDFNDDGRVDVIDYNFFLHNFKEFRGD